MVFDKELLKKMFLAGAKRIQQKKEWINELNVFPVPDGDTGTNMTLTILSAVSEVEKLDTLTYETLGKAISSGSLRGARGNSGVILSQLLRGFTKQIRKVEEGTVLTPALLTNAFSRAVEIAYKAVMKPKEGTILTVARGVYEKAEALLQEEGEGIPMETFLKEIVSHGDLVLSKTPELLPVLKQAGVVDSGGQGLMQILHGALDCYLGKETGEFELEETVSKSSEPSVVRSTEPIETDNIVFGYCTEFIVNLQKPLTKAEEDDVKSYLEGIGDSIVCVADDDYLKIHVHTNDPGLAIQKGLTHGPLSRIKIDNMREEHEERLFKNAEALAKAQKEAEEEKKRQEEKKPFGFVSVSVGEGIEEIFRGLGVDAMISGGQTMNPSTDDILKAVEGVNAEAVFILPNNKNIILAAEQCTKLMKDRKVYVVPTRTIPQGISALVNFNPDKTAEENVEFMTRELQGVKSCEITYSIRDTVIDGKEIHKDDVMAIGDHGILAVSSDLKTTLMNSVEAMVDEESSLISLYYGADVSDELAEEFAAELTERYPMYDVECNKGGQPIYYFILSVE